MPFAYNTKNYTNNKHGCAPNSLSQRQTRHTSRAKNRWYWLNDTHTHTHKFAKWTLEKEWHRPLLCVAVRLTMGKWQRPLFSVCMACTKFEYELLSVPQVRSERGTKNTLFCGWRRKARGRATKISKFDKFPQKLAEYYVLETHNIPYRIADARSYSVATALAGYQETLLDFCILTQILSTIFEMFHWSSSAKKVTFSGCLYLVYQPTNVTLSNSWKKRP